MNLLFVHSGEKVKEDSNGFLYTDGSYDQNVWKLYLSIFDHITIIMRKDVKIYNGEDAKKKFNLIDQRKINFVPMPDVFSSLHNFISIKLKREKKNLIEKEVKKTDAVIIRVPGDYLAVKYAKKYRKPYMLEVVGCPFDAYWNHSVLGKIMAIPAYVKLKKNVVNAPYAKYVTKSFLQKRYPCRGNVLACSDVRIEGNKKEFSEKREKNFFSNATIVLGTASGVGIKYKGQQYVICAMAELKKMGFSNFKYEIAGNGDSSYLKKLAEKMGLQKEVLFVGSIPHEKIFAWFNHLDVYIQPSRQEGLPRALVEAMSCAIPCLGSNAGGIPELLDQQSIFEKGNVNQIVSLLRYITDPAVRVKLAKKCYETSLQYDSNKLSEKYKSFLKKCFVDRPEVNS